MNLNDTKDFKSLRGLFPILQKCVYLNSNSLGAVPTQVAEDLMLYYMTWAEKGVKAWREIWWDMPLRIGRQLSSFLGAEGGTMAMMPSASVAHWVALSTQFDKRGGSRNKILMTDHDFPSSIYAVSEIARFMDWDVELIPSRGRPGIEVDAIVEKLDEKTLIVATSHVYFKSGYIQDIARVSEKARCVGAISLIDGYHAPGSIPVSLKELGVDFYIGGCLKWLCGGPGNAFLFVREDLHTKIEPRLTGWFAHEKPFAFSLDMTYTDGPYRFMSGTPAVPSLYTASAGLDILSRIGISQIRQKSAVFTKKILDEAQKRGWRLYTPKEAGLRGGSVSLALSHGYQIKQALAEQGIIIDYRQGEGQEPDIIRIGPHFYNTDEEIDIFFRTLDNIYSSGDYKRFPNVIKTVT